jgi:hypothetical protein
MAACRLWNRLLYMERVEEVNKLLPENQPFNILWWHAGKYLRFENSYRRLFPGSKARNREFKLLVIFRSGPYDDGCRYSFSVLTANLRKVLNSYSLFLSLPVRLGKR